MATKKQSYEECITQLEDIVSKMEKPDLTLEERMKLYEEGMKLSGVINKLLNGMESKIVILNKGEEEDFQREV
ncbi:Exodeoxyribonuclease VII small subunit [Hathewaya proteolytica DSM 3090]|uniref:Exodeoxyribonuclease 7 small subunit n=1 Tax=Hathewaya proteolytica DSM 3090 TaxID=1121331 RepID=A0A1M6L4I4_9CLOT|nr:exodeoxyribonuclease VII small subunit [Hathewaya proteolytica]SHJ66128.1 Exodeoxyribonuclease VII small subunit [Hathewaya proteolytica DSM 3090]